VTPVSCALVSQVNSNDTDIDDAALANRSSIDSAEGNGGNSGNPVLFANAVPGSVPEAEATAQMQGAVNGTIGPQGSDATYVTGVNTAGTVRVNNLANLEALLNIVSNLWEVGLMLGGAIIVLNGFVNETMTIDVFGQEIELGRSQRMIIGVAIILLGLAFPGLVNWFVASARDANLFS
jgi:hypothetical protein